ncbi:MAG: MBL fold metallo-hydrolase [Clostridia bacterium]|nr:MBL fold metallo-hydrolase [Clostridia bacterium]
MKLFKYELGDLSVNCYVLVDEKTGDAIAIDIGGDAGFLMLEELKHGYKIKNVLLTHCHFDHIGGVYKFFERGANVYMSKIDERGILDSKYNLSAVFGDEVKPFKLKTALSGGETLKFGNISVEVISTPGHSEGGLTYKVEDMLFCGDTLFSGSFGRVDFPGGDIKTLCDSAKKLFKYKGCTLYSGHGDTTTVDIESVSNPIKHYYDND